MNSPMQNPSPLEYARDNRRSKIRRRMVRFALPLLILVVITPLTWHRHAIWKRANEMYWFHKAMNHVTPPGTVLLEMDESKVKVLLEKNPEYFDPATSRAAAWEPRPSPIAFQRMQTGVRAQYVPTELFELEPLLPWNSYLADASAAIFVGERRSPSGNRRLVVIRSGIFDLLSVSQMLSVGAVYSAPTPTVPIRLLNPQQQGWKHLGPVTQGVPIAGIADPNNPSHLTLEFAELIPHIQPRPNLSYKTLVDVYLQDDDTLKITTRAAPQ